MLKKFLSSLMEAGVTYYQTAFQVNWFDSADSKMAAK